MNGINRIDESSPRRSSFVWIRAIRGQRICNLTENSIEQHLSFADLTSLFCNLRFPPQHPVNPVHPVSSSAGRKDGINGINRIDESQSGSAFTRVDSCDSWSMDTQVTVG